MSAKNRIKILFIAAAALFVTGFLLHMNMHHVSDPINIEEFDPKSYASQQHLGAALEKLFLQGTSKQEIDRILLSKPGVRAEVDAGDGITADGNYEVVIIYFVPKPIQNNSDGYPDSACYIAAAKTHWRYFFHFRVDDKIKDNLTLKKITWVFC